MMHGKQETSLMPRATCTALHGAMVAAAAWIYFGGGAAFLLSLSGQVSPDPGDWARRVVLMGFAVAAFLRITATFFILLKRRFPWSEFWGVTTALFAYQIVFALLAMGEAQPLDTLDFVAIALFLIGSYLNTGSELQRRKFKQDPKNQGKLFTAGLFRYARHINYFGDFLWVAAWALLTRNPWALLIPVILAMGFIFGFIPPLTTYLRSKYGQEFENWEKRTKAFIPFIY
jgi:steroid 5-alpha reductase family enzyme